MSRTPDRQTRAADEARVLAAVEARAPATVEQIRAAIRQRSVSRSGEGIAAMAERVQACLEAMGARARCVPGERAPIVEGELAIDGGRPTLLFYELYDTQPADGQPGWSVDPFEAAMVRDAAGQLRLLGRGAFNSKGPLVAALSAIGAFADAGVALPVGLRFLIEGEEEIGSPSLPAYIESRRAELSSCAAAFIPYFGTGARGDTVLRLGFKGLALLEFRVRGGDWGGPAGGDVHALHGALVASPAWQLVRALASLVDERESLCVDGLAEIVPPPSDEDRELVARAAHAFDLDAYRRELGAARFKTAGEDGGTAEEAARGALAALTSTVTLNLDALAAGRLDGGETPATLVPSTARAFADLRLVPGVAPGAVVELIRRHLDRRGFGHVEVHVRSAYPASRASVREPVVRALIDAASAEAAKLVVLPIHAGAAPMHVFSETLGLPYAFGGVGRGGGAHGPDEHIVADDVVVFMRAVARFLFRFAEHHAARGQAGRA